MSTSTSPHAVRCPRCSAHVRTGSDWCTLCYADLRPAPPVAEPVAATQAKPLAAPVELVDLPAADDVPAFEGVTAAPTVPVGRGKHAKRSRSKAAEPAPAEVEALANQMLAELAVSETKNPLGPLASHLDTPAKRVGFMAGGAVAGICLLFIVMTILGAVFS